MTKKPLKDLFSDGTQASTPLDKVLNRYESIIAKVFDAHYTDGVTSFDFTRNELEEHAEQLKVKLPKNLGDLIYAFKFRWPLPRRILSTAPVGLEWVISSVGIGKYRFRLEKPSNISPNLSLATIKIPDSTPEIISAYALGDEQALLAKVRYNRLVDTFLGISSYSLQNHLRTTVRGIGQIEIDEVYVGVDRHGRQFVIPVQAKGGTDQHGSAQTRQDMACCAEKFPKLICRAISAQFMDGGRIAMFELIDEDGDIKVAEERHYQLVPANTISERDLMGYAVRAQS